MPIVIPPAFFEMSVVHLGPSTVGSSPTWTIGFAGDPTDGGMDDIFGWLSLDYAGELSELYTVTGVRIATTGGSTFAPFSLAGSVAGVAMPPQVATLVRKATPAVGRTNQGRMYWPGLLGASAVGDNGSINTSRHTDLQNLANAFNDAITSSGYSPVILHSGSSDPTAISAFNVETKIATQRRRMRT